MDELNIPKGYIVVGQGKKILLFYTPKKSKNPKLQIDESIDGFKFTKTNIQAEIVDAKGKKVDLAKTGDFRAAKLGKNYVLTFINRQQGNDFLSIAISKNLSKWYTLGKVNNIKTCGMVVPQYTHRGQYVLFSGGNSITISYSSDLVKWNGQNLSVLNLPGHSYTQLTVVNLIVSDEGILLIYAIQNKQNGFTQYSFAAALFDKKNPDRLIWKSDEPIWTLPESWQDKNINLLGVVVLNGKLFSYWQIENDGIYAVAMPAVKQLLDWKANITFLSLNRIKENPILTPISGHFWESKAVFNTAAIYDRDKVHLVYRAIGDNDTSVLGYASSSDGIHIDERLKEPVYVHRFSQDKNHDFSSNFISPFASGGGGYGGCEDPRLTKIGDRIYMTYVYYDGANPPRVAMTSIDAGDFHHKRWNWEKPVLISPPGVVDKNACILPEKINGKFVFFHRIFPNILIDFVGDLNFDGKSKWLPGEFAIKPRSEYWDSRKIGVGATPIKTDDGWLLIYHAVGDRDPSRYKMGAMLLALDDPREVLYRSNKPILEPAEFYENEGHKSGVVYPCGAVCLDKQLVVYYGGADTVVCAATANKDEFISELKNTGSAHLMPVTIEKISN